jgi:3-deoxy-D-manno-octulosonic-acid transferase
MFYWYKFFSYLFLPFAPIYLYFRRLKKKEDQIRYKEKLSKITITRGEGFVLWFHLSSVGEAISAVSLIKELTKEKKITKILITSITVSSSKVLEKKFINNEKIVHQFLPLDIPILVKKFVNHWSPNLSIFIDSEIWPNLINEVKIKKIPLILLNGKITKKTFTKWSLFKNFANKIFRNFDLCIAADEASEKYLKVLGANKIKNYGNLKFSNIDFEANSQIDNELLEKIENRKIWCAASTHPTEEFFCASAHSIIKKNDKNILTIIIPRHVERIKSIINEFNTLKLNFVLYSNFKNLNSETDILLVDTYGDSSKFYGISKSVSLGKSLIKPIKGKTGQNPIEPAGFGCKVFHGPNFNHFKEIYKYLESIKATTQINSPEELSAGLMEEFKNDKINNEIIKEIKNRGLYVLKNVIREIKVYINN